MVITVTSPTFWINKNNPEIVSYGTDVNVDENKLIIIGTWRMLPTPKDDEILYKYVYDTDRGYLLNRNNEIK